MSASQDQGVDKAFTSLSLIGGVDCTPRRAGDLDVRGGARIKKSLCAQGNMEVRKDLSVQGNLITNNISNSSKLTTTDLCVDGNTTVGDLTVTGSFIGGGGFTPVIHQRILAANYNHPTGVTWSLVGNLEMTLPVGAYMLSYNVHGQESGGWAVRIHDVTGGVTVSGSVQSPSSTYDNITCAVPFIVTGGPVDIELQVSNNVGDSVLIEATGQTPWLSVADGHKTHLSALQLA